MRNPWPYLGRSASGGREYAYVFRRLCNALTVAKFDIKIALKKSLLGLEELSIEDLNISAHIRLLRKCHKGHLRTLGLNNRRMFLCLGKHHGGGFESHQKLERNFFTQFKVREGGTHRLHYRENFFILYSALY